MEAQSEHKLVQVLVKEISSKDRVYVDEAIDNVMYITKIYSEFKRNFVESISRYEVEDIEQISELMVGCLKSDILKKLDYLDKYVTTVGLRVVVGLLEDKDYVGAVNNLIDASHSKMRRELREYIIV